ncbi:MAG: glycosyltransferase [Saccharospirillaceae bacterium]|nr:cysteine peptidase family C39 domain-containing protein [Pseudomonadales bacterium]NRB80207.1 glycosyltransferase [Saccharospirillaceae bacterium]
MIKHNFIISVLGTKGDIFPFLKLAEELNNNGYSVFFLTSEHFKSLFYNTDINFIETGTELEYQMGCANPDVWDPKKEVSDIAFKYYHGPAFLRSYEFVKKFKDKKNTTIITLSVNNGARIASDELNFNSVLIQLCANLIPSIISPPAPLHWCAPNYLPSFIKKKIYKYKFKKFDKQSCESGSVYQLNVLRKKINLPPVKDVLLYDYSNEFLHIAFFPEWFGMRPKDWPEKLKLVGFPLFDSVDNNARSLVDNFLNSNPNPILFTTGTGVSNADEMFKECIKICEKLKKPGIFTGSLESQYLFKNKACFLHIDYIDFNHVLPKCSAIIHHGGVGTMAQAIQAGIPQIIRPLLFDQPDNGMRIQKLGLGVVCYPEKFNSKNISPILNKLIQTANDNNNLQTYSSDLKRNNAVDKAVKLIEEYCGLSSESECKDVVESKYPIEFIKVKSINKVGNAICEMMIKSFHKYEDKNNNVYKRFDFEIDLNLKSISDTLRSMHLDMSGFQCEIMDLKSAVLPCICYWESKSFVIVTKIDFVNEMVTLLDPLTKKTEIGFEKFTQKFSNVILMQNNEEIEEVLD